jgi:hypothetical protein
MFRIFVKAWKGAPMRVWDRPPSHRTVPGLLRASVLTLAALFLSSQLASAQYTPPPPTVTAVSPSSGTTLGGTSVLISGTNLLQPTGVPTVTIGGAAATNVQNFDATAITAVTPSGTAGAADVVVTTSYGTGTGSGLFTYLTPAYLQQGSKLVGTLPVGSSEQGQSVALSADGNTAIVGGPNDNSQIGAAWVYTPGGDVWTQQGSKLVASGVVGQVAYQSSSVALSADGNTAIVGGSGDNSGAGAAWIFTRSGSVWIQQAKLAGTAGAALGASVALSADGNIAIVGGPGDNGGAGAAWVFTRNGGVWVQQGSKLVGAGAVGLAHQGTSVALSADGSTAVVGGPNDNSIGVMWVYTSCGGVWSQQGSKLVGSDGAGGGAQGSSIALSADGNTAIMGGPFDNSESGAAWVFTRNSGVWAQQGSKLVGTNISLGSADQGRSVALSGDGNTALVGGPRDGYFGAAWVFARSGGVWTQQGDKLVGSGAIGLSFQGQSVALSGDGSTAILGGFGDNSYLGAAWVLVRPAVPSLQVTPTTNIATAGNPGGPFAPSSFPYQLAKGSALDIPCA